MAKNSDIDGGANTESKADWPQPRLKLSKILNKAVLITTFAAVAGPAIDHYVPDAIHKTEDVLSDQLAGTATGHFIDRVAFDRRADDVMAAAERESFDTDIPYIAASINRMQRTAKNYSASLFRGWYPVIRDYRLVDVFDREVPEITQAERTFLLMRSFGRDEIIDHLLKRPGVIEAMTPDMKTEFFKRADLDHQTRWIDLMAAKGITLKDKNWTDAHAVCSVN